MKPSVRIMACLLVAALLVSIAGGCSPTGNPKPSVTPGSQLASVDSKGVEAALTGLVEAVRQGDCSAYLQHVAESSEHFYQEQAHWCASTRDHPLSSFDLQVSDLHPSGADRVVGQLTKTWQPVERPVTQTVTYEAAFVLDGAGHYRYAGPNWVTTENDRLRLYSFPAQAQLAKDLLAEVTPVWQALAGEFGFTADGPVPVELYPDEQLLTSAVGDFIPLAVGGYTAPGEGIKVVTTVLQGAPVGGEAKRVDKSIEDLRGVVAHELGHYLLHQMAGGAAAYKAGGYAQQLPLWLDEGMAEALSAPYKAATDALRRQELAQLVADGEFAPLSRLSDPATMAPEDSWKVFAEGYGMVTYIAERLGQERRDAWVRAVASGRDVETAAAAAEQLGVSLSQLQQDWRSSLEQS